MLSLAALLVSGLAVLRLGLGDPKRRRVTGLAPRAARRGSVVALALAPGVVLAALGAWAPLTIWIGGAAVLGWATASLLAPARL